MRRIAAAALFFAARLAAQVATEANSGYKTEQQRQGVAKSLANPERDNVQNPGKLVREMGVQAGMTVADVGTGIGYMLPFLSEAVGPKFGVKASGGIRDAKIALGMIESGATRLGTSASVAIVKGLASTANY